MTSRLLPFPLLAALLLSCSTTATDPAGDPVPAGKARFRFAPGLVPCSKYDSAGVWVLSGPGGTDTSAPALSFARHYWPWAESKSIEVDTGTWSLAYGGKGGSTGDSVVGRWITLYHVRSGFDTLFTIDCR